MLVINIKTSECDFALAKSFSEKEFMADLKQVYKAPTKNAAEMVLLELEEKWLEKYQLAVNNWEELSVYFEYIKSIRRIIYTINAIDCFNWQIRKITKTKGWFYN